MKSFAIAASAFLLAATPCLAGYAFNQVDATNNNGDISAPTPPASSNCNYQHGGGFFNNYVGSTQYNTPIANCQKFKTGTFSN